MRQQPPEGFDLRTADEDSITEKLQWVIENRLRRTKEVRGFDKKSFGRVWREPKVTNFNGTRPDKMPDLVFDLQRDSLPILGTQDGLFVECKPVDATHSAGQHYCDRGLSRFTIGDYAWTMQEAMTVAYVRDGRSIATSLLPALSTRQEILGIIENPVRFNHGQQVPTADALHVSNHQRRFDWPDNKGRACNIRIFHSWHSCS